MISVVSFLFRVLERTCDSAVFCDQANHVKWSRLQWISFLARAPVEKLKGLERKPSDWQSECDWEEQLSFATHGGIEEYDTYSQVISNICMTRAMGLQDDTPVKAMSHGNAVTPLSNPF